MATDPRPNFLLFFTDQQRWDTVGAYRSPLGLTPNLDAIASQGTLFEHAFTPQPVCGPARSCLQTGLYATQTGCWHNSIALREDAWTFPKALGAAGYDLAYIGKWHLAHPAGTAPVPRAARGGWNGTWEAADILEFTSKPYDFVVFDADSQPLRHAGYRVDAQTDRVIRFLNQPRDEPFCCMISYLEPHHQNDLHRFVAPDGHAQRYRDAWVPEDLRPFPGDWPSQWPDYCGIIRSLDENFGRLMRELDRLCLRDDTVVLFFSDHGCHFCTRNAEYKRSCHEGSVRVPLVAAGPGFNHGRRAPELASLLDIPATVCDLAGVPTPPLQGRSLRALATAPPGDWRDEVYIQISESGTARALRTERWKYCVTAPGPEREPVAERFVESHLYDLWADPHELTNLVGRRTHRAIADGLRERLKRQMQAAGEPVAEIEAGRFL